MSIDKNSTAYLKGYSVGYSYVVFGEPLPTDHRHTLDYLAGYDDGMAKAQAEQLAARQRGAK